MNTLLRGVKIALAAFFAIVISKLLNLEYPAAAGIIAILTIPDTYKGTLDSVKSRFLSFILAFIIAIGIFYFLGYSTWTFALYLIIYAPLAIYFKLESGLGPVSVLVTHLVSSQSIVPGMILNELLLLSIGHLMTLVFNKYMPSVKNELGLIKNEADENLRLVICDLSDYLKNPSDNSDQNLRERIENRQYISNLEATLDKAEQLSIREIENHGRENNEFYLKYFNMRKSQLDILEEIAGLVMTIHQPSRPNEILADVLERLLNTADIKDSCQNLLDEIHDLDLYYDNSPLPATRDEFENRATTFTIGNYLTQYLTIRQKFRKENGLMKD
ncbi:putative membrane protein [Peptoniphilus sp. ING2-D1G]|nr:putative membrane protein [Peptoniphilus sp. ING2-D1G]